MSSALRKSNNLIGLLEKLNSSFGQLLFNQKCMGVVSSGIAVYTCLDIYLRYFSDPLSMPMAHATFLAFMLIVAMLFTTRGSVMCSAGQRIKDQVLLTRRALDNLAMESFAQWAGDQRTMAKFVMVRELLKKEATVAPQQYISLDKGMILKASAAVMGYCIFLLQFKQAKF